MSHECEAPSAFGRFARWGKPCCHVHGTDIALRHWEWYNDHNHETNEGGERLYPMRGERTMTALVRDKRDEQKALEVVLYVIQSLHDMYHALKALYVADKLHLERYGRIMYGESYHAMDLGPVASIAYDILKADEPPLMSRTVEAGRSLIERRQPYDRLPRRDPNMDYLSKSDIECLDEAVALCNTRTIRELKDMTHDAAWNATHHDNRNGVIDLHAIVDTLPNSEQLCAYLKGD